MQAATYDALLAERDRLAGELKTYRQELMRCGSLAVSDRMDGMLPKGRADHIRKIAYETCWPEPAALSDSTVEG